MKQMIEIFYDGCSAANVPETGDYTCVRPTPPPGCRKATICAMLPICDIQYYWTPGLSAHATERLAWNIELDCGGQRNFPVLIFCNAENRNRLTVGLTDLIDDTRITARMNQAESCYEITVEIALPETPEAFEFILDRRALPWPETLRDWREKQPGKRPEFPAEAWTPVFCTWYAVHADLHAEWVEANCRIARELGFGTLIVDDGWCFDEAKRVSPETMPDWYEWIGDWQVSERKFPDFAAHVRRVKALGMNYMLWVAPFLFGRRSERCKAHRGSLEPDYVEGYYRFNPAAGGDGAAIGKKLTDELAGLIGRYDLDGLKVDFLDIVPPDADRPCARAIWNFVAGLHHAIVTRNPRALIEFRQCYGTLAMLGFATQFRAGDAPYDYLTNFSRLGALRLALGDRVPVHADPAYWAEGESEENIARHMIAMLAGVPMLSMDLRNLPERARRIVRYWMDFYRTHQAVLNFGNWSAVYRHGALTELAVTDGRETVIIGREKSERIVSGGSRKHPVFFLNLGAPTPCDGAVGIFDCRGERSPSPVVPAGGCALF